MKKLLILIAIILFGNICEAKILDFRNAGNNSANYILYNYIKDSVPKLYGEIVSFFVDVDEDKKDEVVGIVKTKEFHNLAGYKLFVLKEKNGIWKPYKSDVYFDNSYKIRIADKKITYFGTDFYKNKKFVAKVHSKRIKTSKNIFDVMKDRKVKKIAKVSQFSSAAAKVETIEINDFHSNAQKPLRIKYKNLSDRTKHYLDLK